MKRIAALALLLAPLSLAPLPLAASEAPQPLPAWLSGAWEESSEEGGEEVWADEFWTPPRAGLMIGAARSGKGDTLQLFEHTRIVRKADGKLSFFAMPNGAPPSEFPLVAAGAQMVEFANPAHDYPQRIRYWREGRMLKARISLFDGSKAFSWTFWPMGAPHP